PMAANVALGENDEGSEAVTAASAAEIDRFVRARPHLPKTVFDPARWQAILGPEYARTVYVLNRGGRWQDFGKQLKDGKVTNVYGKQINLYQEKTYNVKDSMTGKHLSGVPTFIPPYQDSLGNSLLDEEKDYPFNLITFKYIQHTKSRTYANYWLEALDPEGGLLVAASDAARLGLRSGDRVRLVSASNPEGKWNFGPGGTRDMVATVRVVEGMRPGVVGFPLGFGHWGYGSRDVTVDDQVVAGDPRRGRGMHGNAAMRVDPNLKNCGLQDLSGGSAVFYDSRVGLVKV
ncbi:MAG: molybdopterin dinucleotide binding domain-containing protein, partial [Bacillota bacterium]